jgi:hypothetical protein
MAEEARFGGVIVQAEEPNFTTKFSSELDDYAR